MGTDGISLKMLSLCLPYCIAELTFIINQCLEQGYFPKIWKVATIKPLPKNNNPTQLKDLRPISLLSVVSKIAEKSIFFQLSNYCTKNNIIPQWQSGFRKKHSTTTSLTSIIDDIVRATDKGLITTMVLLDYSKAFDSISHELLLAKLSYFGLNNTAISLFKHYLSKRLQKVIIGSSVSDTKEITSGVPQGSILGPLLFNIFTSDLTSGLSHCAVHCYADDTQIYYSYKPSEIKQAVDKINSDLSYLEASSDQHALILNPTKSNVIHYGSHKNVKLVYEYQTKFLLNGNILPVVETVRNLGLYFDKELRFKKHVTTLIQSCYAKLKHLYNFRNILSQKLKLLLVESLIISRFDYCDIAYGPCLDLVSVNRLQTAQNACLRFALNINKFDRVAKKHNHISHLYKPNGWLKLFNRRLLHTGSFVKKVMMTGEPAYLRNKLVLRSASHNINVRSKNALSLCSHSTTFFKRSFTYNAVHVYNSLPLNLVECTNIVVFKSDFKTKLLSQS